MNLQIIHAAAGFMQEDIVRVIIAAIWLLYTLFALVLRLSRREPAGQASQEKPSWTAGVANHPQPNMKISARGAFSRYFQSKPSWTAGVANHPQPNMKISARGAFSRYFQSKSISLIIAAKDEEKDIGRVLGSINSLDYPRKMLEIILVNHRSTDKTREIMEHFAGQSDFSVKVIDMTGAESKSSCKAEALRSGIAEASGELLIFTDAEVRFSPDWLKRLNGETLNFDMCGGSVVIEGDKFFQRMQRIDWLWLCAAGAGFAGLDKPQSVFGKNMWIERHLYDASGGFAEGMVWTEDLDLVNRCRGKGVIGFTLKKECAVYSLPIETTGDFFRQKIRWLKGGIKTHPAGFLAMLTGLLMNFAVLLAMFSGISCFLSIVILKSAAEYIVLGKVLKTLGRKNDLYFIPLYSIFSVLYQTALLLLYPIAHRPKWR